MIDCKKYADQWENNIRSKIERLPTKPKLLVIQFDYNDSASNSYVKGLTKACERVGIELKVGGYHYLFFDDLDKFYDGILVLSPLPFSKGVNDNILQSVPECLDIDCVNPNTRLYKPCTPTAIMKLLEYMDINVEGKTVTVLGRGNVVGKPLVNMLIDSGATVTCCNSHTKEIGIYTLASEIIVSAMGKPNMLNTSHFISDKDVDAINEDKETSYRYQKIIDVGGDVGESVYKTNSLVTPKINGISALTRCALMENLITAYYRARV